jgi:hypothetical protein
VISDVGGTPDLTVRYDDGRRTVEISLVGDWSPPLGTLVMLERWRGDVVSVYDLRSERRHKTDSWPSLGQTASGSFMVVAGAVVLGLAVYAFAIPGALMARSQQPP